MCVCVCVCKGVCVIEIERESELMSAHTRCVGMCLCVCVCVSECVVFGPLKAVEASEERFIDQTHVFFKV